MLELAKRIADNLAATVTCVVLGLLAAQYMRQSHFSMPGAGTQLGQICGWVGFAIIIFLTSYSIRKRWQILWPGSLETWLRWHTFLGTLAIGAVLVHSGFRLGGIFEAGSLVVLIATVISGLFGVLLFLRIPNMLSFLDTRQRVADLPAEIARSVAEMRKMAEVCPESLRATVERELVDRVVRSKVFGRRRDLISSTELLRMAGLSRPDEGTEVIERLCELAAEVAEKKRQVALYSYVKLIEAAGLHIHVALTTALLFLVGAHLFTVWYY